MIKLILHPNRELEQSVELESRTILIGRSDENDLTIDDPSVASHHVCLEKRGEEFIVKDLSKQGLLVDGEPVHEAALAVGSVFTLGEVEILFKGETRREPGVLTAEGEPVAEAGALITTPQSGAGAYLPTETFIQPAHVESERSVASTLPMVSLICGALGPLLLGIGWLLGIILGFVSLANIRRRGGFLRDKRMATWGINLGFAWFVIGFVFIAWHTWSGSLQSTIAHNEQSARRTLEAICVTEYYCRYGHFLDINGNGTAEYGTIEDLEALRAPSMPDLARDLHGYRIVIARADEGGFLCYAEPKAYGRTGRFTYAIGEGGLLRGGDLRGAGFGELDRELALVGQGKSVLETRGEQIAQELVEVAKRAAAAKDYARAVKVVQTTREVFPLTDAVRKILDAIDTEVEPRIVELRSVEELNKALALIEQGEVVRALEVLQAAEKNYPTSPHIVAIRDQIALIREKHFKELEEKAEAIYRRAQQLELAGQFTEAKQEYMKIRDQYSVTTYAKDIDGQIDEIERRISEVEASSYIAQLRVLSPEKDSIEIVRIVELLNRRYAQTDEYERNYDLVQRAERMGRAYNEAILAIGQLKRGEYENALVSFNKAIEQYADIQARLRPYLEECYYAAGIVAFQRRDMRTALDLFERYRRLPPQQNKLPEATLMRTYFEVGKLDYAQGDLKAAEKRLFACSGQFVNSPEFNYTYGSVLMELQEHKRAIEHFTRYFANQANDVDKRYYTPTLRKRGYSQVQLAAILETEIKDLVFENTAYRPLIDTTILDTSSIEQGNSSHNTEKTDEEENTTEDDDDDAHEEPNPDKWIYGPSRPDLDGIVLAQAETDGEKTEQKKTTTPPGKPAFRRILDLIVEIQQAESQLKTERIETAGESGARDRLQLKRTRLIQEFQQKQASLRIDIDRENISKREILGRLEHTIVYLTEGMTDLKTLNTVTVRNRDLEVLIQKLETKRILFGSAYSHLSLAYQQDVKIQHDAYMLLDLALKEFSGWPNPKDIAESLRVMFMMQPGTERVAEGLRVLLKGFDVETDLETILRSDTQTGT